MPFYSCVNPSNRLCLISCLLNFICVTHDLSKVELIGYAASKDELYLIYEYSQKGSLKNHLHDPQSKGIPSFRTCTSDLLIAFCLTWVISPCNVSTSSSFDIVFVE